MRRRRCRHWLLPIALWASLIARNGPAQTSSLPPAIEEMQGASRLARQSPVGAASDLFAQAAPPTPLPIPGPAGVGIPAGGTDAVVPEGLPINLAAAMQLSGVRPLDIAAAMAQVQQALALQLQAKALWIPTLNGGVTYFRHDGVQQDIFTGPNFRKGLQTFFVGGGPSLFVGLTDAIFSPLAARRVVAARRADLQAARNDVLLDTIVPKVIDAPVEIGDPEGLGLQLQGESLLNLCHGRGDIERPDPGELHRGRQVDRQAFRHHGVHAAHGKPHPGRARDRLWSWRRGLGK